VPCRKTGQLNGPGFSPQTDHGSGGSARQCDHEPGHDSHDGNASGKFQRVLGRARRDRLRSAGRIIGQPVILLDRVDVAHHAGVVSLHDVKAGGVGASEPT